MSAPPLGLVLGSGLGAFADSLEGGRPTPYCKIPGWPPSTAIGHSGKMVEACVGGAEVIVLSGRAHLYEGYTPQQVAFSIRELHRRGVRRLILTNAAGGVNAAYRPGQLVLISDHINLTGGNPLTGPNDDSLGPRFPDMSEAYSCRMRKIAQSTGAELGLELQEGVYAGVLGPSYETPAEIRYLRAVGADLVGMSTVAEAIAANHLGMEVLGISCVTNLAAGVRQDKLVHENVLAIAAQTEASLGRFLRALLPRLA